MGPGHRAVQTGHLAVSTRAHSLVQHTHGVFCMRVDEQRVQKHRNHTAPSLTHQARTHAKRLLLLTDSQLENTRKQDQVSATPQQSKEAAPTWPQGLPTGHTHPHFVTRTRSPIRSNTKRSVLFVVFCPPFTTSDTTLSHKTHVTRSVRQSWRTVANRLVVQPLPASRARSPSCMFQLLLRMTLCWCCSAVRDLMWAKRICCLNMRDSVCTTTGASLTGPTTRPPITTTQATRPLTYLHGHHRRFSDRRADGRIRGQDGGQVQP